MAASGDEPDSRSDVRAEIREFLTTRRDRIGPQQAGLPVYGGNRNHVGWEVIGFPGPKSLSLTQTGQFSTVEYMLPNAEWPYAATDTGS